MFPDPNIIKYYNDKYRQFLFLKANNFPIPETIPLFSEKSVEEAHEKLGYPWLSKIDMEPVEDRYSRLIRSRNFRCIIKCHKWIFFNLPSVKYLLQTVLNREFIYFLIKGKNTVYPFVSKPIIAQKFIHIDRDLKTVVGNHKMVEAHWRHQANENMWKVNIDDGGVGVWSKVPQEAIDISLKLAKQLKTKWLNIDMILDKSRFLITEFSPVWHHYAYKEKPSFIYKGDYNIDMPLEKSLDLEEIIIESMISEKK